MTESYGPCRVISEIGAGGMGRVYLAELTEDRPYAKRGTRVAVKVLHPMLESDEELVRRFERESKIGEKIRHPSVIITHESGVESSSGSTERYMVLEYVPGTSLRQLMTQLGTVPEALLRHISARIARGLAAVHAAGAIHRDLKPENVLITPEHEVKVMDLGIVHIGQATSQLTRTGMALGTFSYSAPEQLGAEGVTARSDLYSLGVIMYEAASGTQPFAAESFPAVMWRHYELVPPRLGTVNSTLTPFLDEIVANLLQKDPALRFESADSLAAALEDGEESDWWRARETSSKEVPQRGALRNARIARETAFVGRSGELDTLRELFAGAARGKSGANVLIDGESGIGKSRLIAEFVDEIERGGEKVTVLYGSCPPDASGYAGLARAVVDHFGSATLATRLAGCLHGPASLIAAFTSLLAGEVVGSDQRIPDDTVQSLFAELARSMADRNPLVWIVDDVAFATPEGRRVIATLGDQVRDHKMLLVLSGCVVAGSEIDTLFTSLPNSKRMAMPPLDEAAVVRLVSDKVHRASLAEELGGNIAARSRGNPLFVIETLREMERSGTLTRFIEDPGAMRREIEELPVGATVRDMLRARLRNVSENERALLDVAAVYGQEIDADLVARSLGQPRLAVLQSLAAIERRTGIVRSVRSTFSFDHPEMREVIYQLIPDILRAEYHAALADSYTSRMRDTGVASPSGADSLFLARHFLLAGRRSDGIASSLPALTHLAAQYGTDRQTITLGDLALEAVSDTETAIRCEIQLWRADAFNRLGHTEDQRAATEDAMRAATRIEDKAMLARAGYALARARLTVGEYEAASEILEPSLEHAKAAGDKRWECEIAGSIGRIHLLKGRLAEAESFFIRFIALAQEVGDPRMECQALSVMSNMLLAANRQAEASAFLEREMSIAMDRGFRDSEIMASFGLGMVAMWRGEHGAARRHFEHQLSLSRDLVHGSSLAHLGLVMLWCECGQLDKVEQHLARGLDRAETAQLRHLVVYLRMYAGDAERARGNEMAAESFYRTAIEEGKQLGAQLAVAEATFAFGRLQMERGRRDEARALLRESKDLVDRLKLTIPGPLPAAYLALMGEGTSDGLADSPMGRCAHWAELNLLLSKMGHGDAHLEKTGELLEKMSSHLDEEERGQFWANNPTGREFLRLTGARPVPVTKSKETKTRS
jgi:tetratricopeptide (TPR) repeat protein/tRNA A-37 threonylcarbamoyl transferase component Bud32